MLTAEQRRHKQFTKIVIENDTLTSDNKRLQKEVGYLKELNMQHVQDKVNMQDEIRDLYNFIYVLNGGSKHDVPFTNPLSTVLSK